MVIIWEVTGEISRRLLPLPRPELVDHPPVAPLRSPLLRDVVALAGERRVTALLARELAIAAYS